MRIRDWSSDVCSSDLAVREPANRATGGDVGRVGSLEPVGAGLLVQLADQVAGRGEHDRVQTLGAVGLPGGEVGRASWRERVCQHVESSVVDVSLKQKLEK